MTNLELINKEYDLYQIICNAIYPYCKRKKCPFREYGGWCEKEKRKKEKWLEKQVE